MLSLTPLLHFQDPWKRPSVWRLNSPEIGSEFDELLDQRAERIRLDTTKLGTNAKLKAKRVAEGYKKANEAGHRTFKATDQTLDKDGREQKEYLVHALQKFEDATGIDEQEYIQKVISCTEKKKLYKMEESFKRGGIAFYQKKLAKSGIYEPLKGYEAREKSSLEREQMDLIEWFSDLPLDTEEEGMPSMIDTLSSLEEEMRPRKEFREKLKKQSTFIKDEYFRQLRRLKFVDSKKELLQGIINDLKGFHKEPSAIQYEFSKVSKKTDSTEKTLELMAPIKAKHEKLSADYRAIILENGNLFGGKIKETPFGPMREAAWEYLEWFGKLKNFTEMESALKALPKEIVKRTAIYSERNELIADLPPDQQEKIKALTDGMRLHTLRPYLKDLRELVKKNSIHALEYIALLETAEDSNGYPLFTAEEKMGMRRRILVEDPELQEAELKILKGRKLPERLSLHQEYFNLDRHIRKDKRFLESTLTEKQNLLMQGIEREHREEKNPFSLEESENMSSKERVSLLLNKLKSKDGKKAANQAMEKADDERELVEAQNAIVQKLGGLWSKNREKGDTQVMGIMRSNSIGARIGNEQLFKGAFKGNTVKIDERNQYMAETFKTDLIALAGGVNRTWGGRAHKVQFIKGEGVLRNDKTIAKQIAEAEYAEDVMMMGKDGKDILDPIEVAHEGAVNALVQMIKVMAKALGIRQKDLTRSLVEAFAAEILDQEYSEMAEYYEEESSSNMHLFEEVSANVHSITDALAA